MRNDPAWRAGYAAYCAGEPYTINPFDFDTLNADMWETGWMDAASDMSRE